MDDQPVTVGIFGRFQQTLFLQLEGLESRLTARIDAVNSRVDDVYGHVDGLYHRMDRLETEYQMGARGAAGRVAANSGDAACQAPAGKN
jgi:hypothetical protein